MLTPALLSPDTGEVFAEGLDDCVHGAIEQVLRIFPASSSCLATVLRENFPHKRLGTATHTTFLRNVLRILDDSPGLYEFLLTCIVEKCIQLDVSVRQPLAPPDTRIPSPSPPPPPPPPPPPARLCRWSNKTSAVAGQVDIKLEDRRNPEEEDGDDDEDDHPEPFEMDEVTEGQAAGAKLAQDEQPAETTATKLDQMMDLLMGFIQRQCRNRGSPEGDRQAEELFRALMRVFDSIILTT